VWLQQVEKVVQIPPRDLVAMPLRPTTRERARVKWSDEEFVLVDRINDVGDFPKEKIAAVCFLQIIC
jgi:hypothetical protein